MYINLLPDSTPSYQETERRHPPIPSSQDSMEMCIDGGACTNGGIRVGRKALVGKSSQQ